MKSLYLLLLLSGSIPFVLQVRLKYYLIQQGRNWSDAQAYCKAKHTDLAIVENNDHMVTLLSEAQKNQLASSAWLGLYNDIHSWRWSFKNKPLGSTNMWLKGEPNNAGGHQECIVIFPYGWVDRDCTTKYSFICFDDTKSGLERYINISDGMSWREAQSHCRQYYTDLTNTLDQTEYSIVKEFFPVAWIGLFRDAWKWVDNTTFSTLRWLNKQPDNLLKNENCGFLNSSQVGDALCSDVMPFFCYREITGKKQIIRLKIKSTDNMKGPDVKVAILDQIKQKLRDHGVAENITVKWIEQPDGVVFHKEKRTYTP
ncbi:secretory phospholipase A2 receptor-like isoform X1 [Silurus asotus]|uniref:Secretory phospholipase A2 receptor-like isoform X1 n=1 Tax=Silurus asotus TaxID=30991 RepID=A0AAD4ZZL6_SILAS|nr:secretory phospholipase A2 receptor-like isoform X1 [Silurus asotus]